MSEDFVYCEAGSCGYNKGHTGGHSWETDKHLIKKLDEHLKKFKALNYGTMDNDALRMYELGFKECRDVLNL